MNDKASNVNRNIEVPDFAASIRRVDHEGEIYFSLVDVMAHFVGEPETTWKRGKKAGQEKKLLSDPRVIWQYTKKRLVEEGFEVSGKIIQLKMTSADGKKYNTDCATAETVLRIVQSIPSPKAEPIRAWIASVAHERLQELADPNLGIDRAAERYAEGMADRYGLDRNEALKAAIKRLQGKVTRRAMTDVMRQYITDAIYYGAFTDTEYLGLFGKRAKQIGDELGGKPRDVMTPEALNFIDIAEGTCLRAMQHRGEMTFNEACILMRQIAEALGVNVKQLEQITGLSLLSGKPLLGSGQ